MMKKVSIMMTVALASMGAMAQSSYDAYNVASSDLNGTARYVGMGGALGALGGDISVMGSNPAGTAMFRKNDMSFTLSGVFGDDGVLGHDGSRASIDNAGAVVVLDVDEGGLQYVNFGVNFTKNRNFLSNVRTGIDNVRGLSQTAQIADMVRNCDIQFGFENIDDWGALPYLATNLYDGEYVASLIDIEDEFEVDDKGNFVLDKDGNPVYLGTSYYWSPANNASFLKSQWGSTSQTDMNISFNVLDKYFFGASVGLYNINYHRESMYSEVGEYGNSYDIYNYYDSRGDGLDLKFGFICRPIDDSPFRFGIDVHTPTWYSMEDARGANINYSFDGYQYYNEEYNTPFEYNYRTPWKFGLSLGYTVDNYFAVGAEYEYTDMSTAKFTTRGDFYSDYYYAQNEYIKDNLKGQSTLKLGMEVKPVPAVSIRAGYNYVSSPFRNNAYNTLYYADDFTETDYTNWKDTHRFTLGLGYRYKGGYIDLAYQYQSQKGDFYAFDEVNLTPTQIDNNRSQLMCTFGFRF